MDWLLIYSVQAALLFYLCISLTLPSLIYSLPQLISPCLISSAQPSFLLLILPLASISIKYFLSFFKLFAIFQVFNKIWYNNTIIIFLFNFFLIFIIFSVWIFQISPKSTTHNPMAPLQIWCYHQICFLDLKLPSFTN